MLRREGLAIGGEIVFTAAVRHCYHGATGVNGRGDLPMATILVAVTIFMVGTAAQLVLETSAELTAETLADGDIGIVAGHSRIAAGDIIDISPAGMIVMRR